MVAGKMERRTKSEAEPSPLRRRRNVTQRRFLPGIRRCSHVSNMQMRVHNLSFARVEKVQKCNVGVFRAVSNSRTNGTKRATLVVKKVVAKVPIRIERALESGRRPAHPAVHL